MITFILVTIASDIGGYAAGVTLGKHPMAPVISPKKSWEGFAGSASPAWSSGGRRHLLLDGRWWVGVVLGVLAAVAATLGDLCESVIKRDLGIKDMSQVVPGHGGLMDRLDSLLATVAPTWLLLYYLVDLTERGPLKTASRSCSTSLAGGASRRATSPTSPCRAP